MKSFLAMLALTCAASAATLAPLAVCNARKGESCPGSNQRGCENNGGHSMLCVATSPGKYNWIYADNCPDSKAHCDCATGFCVPN
ncbi:hypothetical protein GRF29_1g1899879 [Pseudopithomyces chartarum]|uniref:Uncharacterized protein n=1 Tax=Pseudopithomyces chartarum TaxID=1892770 RepID=A0AAN6M9B0_9PLEO|nr:hypothetical protein GRF29_1g1899879 [Pseudopithomyces chartarum]